MTAIPALTAMAGAGAARLVASTGAIRWRMVWITSSIAAISWLWVPVFGSDLERSLRGQGSAERGRLLIRAGRVHEGTEALRRGVQLDPDNAYGWIDLGEALAAAGAHAEAERAVREASRLAPALPYPHFRLGVLLFQAGRLAEAAEAFERAYRLDPLDRAVANNLLGTLMRLGRFRDAREIRTEMEVNGVPVDDALKN